MVFYSHLQLFAMFFSSVQPEMSCSADWISMTNVNRGGHLVPRRVLGGPLQRNSIDLLTNRQCSPIQTREFEVGINTRRALAGTGGHWRALAGTGGHWRALAGTGGHWRALAGSQVQRNTGIINLSRNALVCRRIGALL